MTINDFLQRIFYSLLIATIVLSFYIVVEGLKANASREVRKEKEALHKQYWSYELLAGKHCEEKCVVDSICYKECLKGNLIDAE